MGVFRRAGRHLRRHDHQLLNRSCQKVVTISLSSNDNALKHERPCLKSFPLRFSLNFYFERRFLTPFLPHPIVLKLKLNVDISLLTLIKNKTGNKKKKKKKKKKK